MIPACDHGTARRRFGAVCALAAALHLASAAANPNAPAEIAARPAARARIGLVLGGGGAKGAAHIGVIKVLEQMRIPVDCIAGTSMGSLVGAAYATGMSSQQLEQFITQVDWAEILATAPRQEVPVQRKRQDFAFPIGLELGVKGREIVFPGGLVPTHQIEALFRRVVAGAGEVDRFDRLPIPFRAVATDLESGQMYVFDHGDLAVAMRASMAVPGAFAPVEVAGRVLADGMLVRNLPVDVARQACADIVIAVPVGNPEISREKLSRLTSVVGQAMNIAIEANERAQLATLTDRDVLIPVLLKDIGSSDFVEVPRAIPIGENAARAAMASLSRYSLSPQDYATWRSGLRDVAATPSTRIDAVQMRGFRVTNPDVMASFVTARPGDLYDPDVADADATRIAARGDFAAVSTQLTAETAGNVLSYTATEKSWGPDYLQFALNLYTNLRGETGWGIRLDHQRRWLNPLGGEFRASVQIGRPNALFAEFYQPIDLTQRFFVAPIAYATQTLGYVYSADERLAELDQSRRGLQLDGGVALGSWGEARVGLFTGKGQASTSVAVSWLPDQSSHQLGGVALGFVADTLDKRVFPAQGTYANVGVQFSDTRLGADLDYQLLGFGVAQTLTRGANVWTFSLRGGSDFGSGVPVYDQFRAGGLFDFSGYQLNELIGREFGLAAIGYRRRIGWLFETLETAAWIGGTLEVGNVYKRPDGTPASGVLTGGSVYLGVNSMLGPVYLAYGRSEGGRSVWYLTVGSSLEPRR